MPAFTPGPGSRRRLPQPALRIGHRKDPDSGTGLGNLPDETQECDPEAVVHASAAAAEIVRWGVFASALVPCTLLTCGSTVGTATGAAVGLAAVTAACRTLLRHSGRVYAMEAGDEDTVSRPGPHRGRHSRTGTGLHRGQRHPGPPSGR